MPIMSFADAIAAGCTHFPEPKRKEGIWIVRHPNGRLYCMLCRQCINSYGHDDQHYRSRTKIGYIHAKKFSDCFWPERVIELRKRGS